MCACVLRAQIRWFGNWVRFHLCKCVSSQRSSFHGFPLFFLSLFNSCCDSLVTRALEAATNHYWFFSWNNTIHMNQKYVKCTKHQDEENFRQNWMYKKFASPTNRFNFCRPTLFMTNGRLSEWGLNRAPDLLEPIWSRMKSNRRLEEEESPNNKQIHVCFSHRICQNI